MNHHVVLAMGLVAGVGSMAIWPFSARRRYQRVRGRPHAWVSTLLGLIAVELLNVMCLTVFLYRLDVMSGVVLGVVLSGEIVGAVVCASLGLILLPRTSRTPGNARSDHSIERML